MLKSIYVDGLGSLNDFKLDLQPGLNVLVGPNGSGKTNILNAFSLIGFLDNLKSLALAGSVGSTEITELFDIHREEKCIRIILDGEFDPNLTAPEPLKSEILGEIGSEFKLGYKYDCELKQKPIKDSWLKFSNQTLELMASYLDSNRERKTEKFKIKLDNGGIKVISLDKLFTEKLPISDYDSYFNSNNYIYDQRSIFHEFCREKSRLRPVMVSIAENFGSTSIYNVSPSMVRAKSENPVFALGIDQKGGGLLSELHRIMELSDGSKSSNVNLRMPILNYADVHEKILGCLNQISPEISGLEVKFDEERKLYFGYVEFVSEGMKKSKIPFELLSDGTLKWLAVVTALLTTKNTFLLEEPENYLHPTLQRQFTNFARDVIGFCHNIAILSTHSETVLDALDPSEVIITQYRNKRTHVSRIENLKKLRSLLHDNGFGLGWYYASGALDPVSDDI